MLKQSLLVLVAASVLSAAAPLAAAQDNPPAPNNQSQSNDQQANDQQANDQQQAPPAPGSGHSRHGGPDPADRVQHLTRKLKLTSDQQTKVLEILQSERSQMQSLHQDTSLSQQDRRSKMMDIHKSADAQVRGLLDSNQQKKWDEMQAKREQWMQNGRKGPSAGGDQQAPPPQQ